MQKNNKDGQIYRAISEINTAPLPRKKINCEAHDEAVKILRIMRYVHMDHRFMSEFNITTGGTRMKLAGKQKTAEAAFHLHNRSVACISTECCKS